MDTVDYVATIIFVATINGYIWHLSWIFMFLLKGSKLFVTNLSTILDFEALGDQETIFNQLYHILHRQKHMFRDKVCGSVIIRSWGMEYPIFSFSYFFSWRPFWKCSRRGSTSQNFPVNITDSYSIGCKLAEKYKFVNLWEGCMMGLLRLQSTRLSMHDGPEIMLFMVVS